MKPIFKFLILFAGICTQWFIHYSAFSQDTTQNKIELNKSYFKSFLLDARDIAIAPAHWKETQWTLASGIVTTTGILLVTDKTTHRFFQLNRTPLTNNLSTYGFEPIGSGKYSFPILGAFGLHYAITKNQRSGRVFFLGTKSLALSGITVLALKNIFQRHRPYKHYPVEPNRWDFITGGFKNNSFPSGHTITAFSIATLIATEYHDKPIIPIICYTLATLSGLSRVHDNKHFLSDVFMGAALGFSISKMVYFRNNWKINLHKKHSILVNTY